jgi:hypothetical protein
MSRKYVTRVCLFNGVDGGPVKGKLRCTRGGCEKPAKRYLGFVWGSAPVCLLHFREDLAVPLERP